MSNASGLLPAYLVVGPDELKRSQAVARMKAKTDGPFQAFNLEEIHAAADLEPTPVLSSLNTLPMGTDLRVVVIENAGKLPKPVSEAIIGYLSNPNESCCLLLAADSLAKTTRLYKAVAKLGPKAVVECESMKRWDLPPYVQKLARVHGVTFDRDAAEELVARVGESTKMLDTQVSTLAALLGGSGNVTRDFVEGNVARTVEVKPWEFLDRLSERDAKRSFELLRLLSDGSAIGLLSLIVARIRELICARSLSERGEAAGIAEALGKKGWAAKTVKNHPRLAAAFAPGELERLLVECACADRDLKSGADSDATMAVLVSHICGIR